VAALGGLIAVSCFSASLNIAKPFGIRKLEDPAGRLGHRFETWPAAPMACPVLAGSGLGVEDLVGLPREKRADAGVRRRSPRAWRLIGRRGSAGLAATERTRQIQLAPKRAC